MKEHRGQIHWKSTLTGATGHGSKILDFTEAKEFMEDGTKRYPWLKHWFIPVWE